MKISEITQSDKPALQEGIRDILNVPSAFVKSLRTGLSTEEQLEKDEFTKTFVRSFNDYLQSGLKSGSISKSPPAKRAPPKPKQSTPTGTSTGSTVISSPTNKVTP